MKFNNSLFLASILFIGIPFLSHSKDGQLNHSYSSRPITTASNNKIIPLQESHIIPQTSLLAPLKKYAKKFAVVAGLFATYFIAKTESGKQILSLAEKNLNVGANVIKKNPVKTALIGAVVSGGSIAGYNLYKKFRPNIATAITSNVVKSNSVTAAPIYNGITNGLAATNINGYLLRAQTKLTQGSGKIIFQDDWLMGQKLKQSAQTALDYIKENALKLKINPKDLETQNFNISLSFADGEHPIEGTSAGITIAISIISALKKANVDKSFAMTGTIDKFGNIGPIGRLAQKVQGAKLYNIKNIIAPMQNIFDVNEEKINGINMLWAGHISEVMDRILIK